MRIARRTTTALVTMLLAATAGGCSAAEDGEPVENASDAVSTTARVTLRTTANPRYVSAENGGGGAVNANRTAAQAWETFTLVDVNGGALTSGDAVFVQASNGKYVQAVDGGGGALNAGSANRLGWETFKVVRQKGAGTVTSGDVVGLQTTNGRWLTAAGGGGAGVSAGGSAFSGWEQFTLTLVGGTTTPTPTTPTPTPTPTTPPPTPTTPPPTTPTPTPTTTCKRGISYNNEATADVAALRQGVGWWYNWGSSPAPAVTSAFESAGFEYVPMVWSGAPNRTIDVQGLIASIPKSAKYLLGFNEPNFGVQANMTPEQAAREWPKLEEIARARNLKLVSPAVNYCGGACNETDPFVWLDKFFAACPACKVDYVAFHWYAGTVEALRYITGQFVKKYARPVWLTEFSRLDEADISAGTQKTYMDAAIPFLEGDPNVFRYSWFIGRSSNPGPIDILGSPGTLTPLGQSYVNYAGRCAH